MIRRTLISLSVIASLGAALPPSVLAQSDYPTKPVKFIVPFPPGGTSDIMGRMAAEELGKQGLHILTAQALGYRPPRGRRGIRHPRRQ